jgi:MurNAc alpha-1-phosphate uridylyltransferase
MILAAGRGERLRPVTDTLPKALVRVHGRPLIEWQVLRLIAGGWRELVINHAWLGQMIEDYLGSGERYGAHIHYSREGEALETLGGVIAALPALGSEAFLLVSADIFTGFDYSLLIPIARELDSPLATHDAHFVLVENPSWHPKGDMGLDEQGQVTQSAPLLTYANISVYHPRLFSGLSLGTRQKLFPWGFGAVRAGRVSGQLYRGPWFNIGTAADLALAERDDRDRTASAGSGSPA